MVAKPREERPGALPLRVAEEQASALIDNAVTATAAGPPPREVEVAVLIARDGSSNAELARRLSVAPGVAGLELNLKYFDPSWRPELQVRIAAKSSAAELRRAPGELADRVPHQLAVGADARLAARLVEVALQVGVAPHAQLRQRLGGRGVGRLGGARGHGP